jgi:hypothetical protein
VAHWTRGGEPSPEPTFAAGDRVRVVEGLPGTVRSVEEANSPDAQYVVVLDDGQGGGEYSADELQPLGKSASFDQVAAEDRADHWYPELGTILEDRLPPARSVVASLRRLAGHHVETPQSRRLSQMAAELLTEANAASWVPDAEGEASPYEEVGGTIARTAATDTPIQVEADGWVRDMLTPPTQEYSYDWCRFRRANHCWYPKELDAAATAREGYAVWVPEDRDRCLRTSWQAQQDCPIGAPGPNAGGDGLTDATVPYGQGGQRGFVASASLRILDSEYRYVEDGGMSHTAANEPVELYGAGQHACPVCGSLQSAEVIQTVAGQPSYGIAPHLYTAPGKSRRSGCPGGMTPIGKSAVLHPDAPVHHMLPKDDTATAAAILRREVAGRRGTTAAVVPDSGGVPVYPEGTRVWRWWETVPGEQSDQQPLTIRSVRPKTYLVETEQGNQFSLPHRAVEGVWDDEEGGGPHRRISSIQTTAGPYADAIREHGGFTTKNHLGDNPAGGYMVSLDKDSEHALPADSFTDEDVEAYKQAHADALADPNAYLGAWHYGGQVYLDVSHHFDSEDEANDAAVRHNQIAYYDLANGREVTTRQPQGQVAASLLRLAAGGVPPVEATFLRASDATAAHIREALGLDVQATVDPADPDAIIESNGDDFSPQYRVSCPEHPDAPSEWVDDWGAAMDDADRHLRAEHGGT